MRFAELRHFVLIYDCPNDTVLAREFDDHTAAAVAYEELDPESMRGMLDVTVVSAESIETLEKLHACPVTFHRTAEVEAPAPGVVF